MNPQKVHENILGLEYLEGTFTNEELQQISNLLETNGITFLSHSKESRPIAGIDILFPQIQAFLSNDLVQSIALGLLTDVMYDALKAFPKLVRKLSQGKPFFKVKAGGTITQSVPNIHFTIGKIHAVLPMETDDEKYEYFVDKMFEFASNQQVSEMSYLILDDTTGDMQLLTREQFLEKIRNEHVIK